MPVNEFLLNQNNTGAKLVICSTTSPRLLAL